MKSIPNFPDYAITKDGRVWSKPRNDAQGHNLKGRWLKSPINSHGYRHINLFLNRQRHPCKIHRLVLETYVGPCPLGLQCRHLDGNPLNNNLDNLCWGTQSENQLDSIQHGTSVSLRRGELSPASKLTEQIVRIIIYIYRTGLFTQQEIAKQYNITQATVSTIIRKKTWKHLYAEV